MKAKGPYPPRIHALLARDAPVGVVFRRGPGKQVCTFLWDRARDEFQIGQWLKGIIYERRSDLSPDGKYLIYFAMKGRWESESTGSWTAISRAPYLKALAIFPKGDCWNGGGLFTGQTSYWLNDGRGHSVLRDSSEVTRDLKFQPPARFGGECLSVYYPRLLRDAWGLIERVWVSTHKEYDVLEKPIQDGWILRKLAYMDSRPPPGKGFYRDEHELVHPASGRLVRYPDWEWAEVDRHRIVWAAGGKLFAGRIGGEGITDESLLFDFNGMTFERIEAPY